MIRPPLLIRFLLYCSLFLMLVWPSTTPRGKRQRGKATEKDNGQEEMLDLAYHWSKLKLSPPA